MRSFRQAACGVLTVSFTSLPLAAQGTPPASADLARLLAVDASAAPVVTVVGSRRDGDVTIDDVTFPSVSGSPPIEAYIIRPATAPAAGLAGVLFVHWFGPPAPTSNRTQFVDEAKALARRGTVSLLVSTFWSDPARYQARRWETDFQHSLNQAKGLRRALDVLLAQPGVDPLRIAYVVHDYGAMFGAVVSAVDPRPRAFVLIAAASRFANWYLFGSSSGVPTGAARESFLAQLAPIEPVNAIAGAKATFFFQYGE